MIPPLQAASNKLVSVAGFNLPSDIASGGLQRCTEEYVMRCMTCTSQRRMPEAFLKNVLPDGRLSYSMSRGDCMEKNAETIKTSDPAHFTSGFLDRHSSASCAAGSCDDEISVRRRKDLGGCDRHLSGIRLFGRKDRRQKDGEQKNTCGGCSQECVILQCFFF